MLSMGFVLLMSRKVQRMSMLIISGVMIGYICSAITDLVVTFADDADIVNLHNWSKGSFSGITWENVAVMTVVILPFLLLSFSCLSPSALIRWEKPMHRIWESTSACPGGFSSFVQHFICLHHGFCRPCVLCGNCCAPFGKKSFSDIETDSYDSGVFSGRRRFLPVL